MRIASGSTGNANQLASNQSNIAHEMSMTGHDPDTQEHDQILPCEFILTL